MKNKLARAIALLLAWLAAVCADAAAKAASKPDVVFLFADDWGWG